MKRTVLHEDWMPDKVWRQVKRLIPIPCVDVLLENSKGEILVGWRRIPPYQNVWALPGGRVYRGESLRDASMRILAGYGLSSGSLFVVGIFPVKFPTRADFTVCLASNKPKGLARPDGYEFSSFKWKKRVPSKIGANYARMILKWQRLRRNARALEFAALD
jgi:ADP-ribose pyrophosphatase YjhB (NUDIX family)